MLEHGDRVFVITAYEPDLEHFEPGLKVMRKRWARRCMIDVHCVGEEKAWHNDLYRGSRVWRCRGEKRASDSVRPVRDRLNFR